MVTPRGYCMHGLPDELPCESCRILALRGGRRIAIYADGADLKTMAALADRVSGFTTNPSLCRKAGVTDYRKFAREVLAIADGKPVSFEVLADDGLGIYREGMELASLGQNVFVKVPWLNSNGSPNIEAITNLVCQAAKVNVTAVFTVSQAQNAALCLGGAWHIISVFAGRIADAGTDPSPIVREISQHGAWASYKTLWASARQVYSVIEAERAGADVITLTPDLIAKLDGFGRDLEAYSLETVRQFAKDAEGITL